MTTLSNASGRASGRQEPAVELDGSSEAEQVLALRLAGRSFRGIAEALGLAGSRQAFDAFVDAVRSRPPADRDRLRVQELARLVRLEGHIQSDERLSESARAWRVETLQRLRAKLMEV